MEDLNSIRKRLLIKVLYYAVGLVLLSVTAYLGYFGITSAIKTVKRENSESIYSAVYGDALGFKQFLNLYKATLIPIKTDKNILSYLEGEETDVGQIDLLLENTRLIGNLKAAYIMNSEGVCVFSTDKSLLNKNYSFRPYFEESISGKDSIYLAEGITTADKGLYLSTPICADNSECVVGVIKVSLEDVNALLNDVKHYPSGIYGFSSDDGVLIASSNDQIISIENLSEETISEIKESKEFNLDHLYNLSLDFGNTDEYGISHYFDSNGKEYIITEVPIESFDLNLVEVAPYDEAFAQSDIISKSIRGMGYGVFVGMGSIVIIFILLVREERLSRNRIEKLTEKLDKFKLAFENASDHMVITDAEGVAIHANKKASEITGYSNEEIVGRKVGTKENWGGLMDKSVYESLWNTIKIKKESFKGFLKNKRKNGEIYDVEAKISPVLTPKGEVHYFVGIERDITEEKKLERAKSEFVSIASHQLRTPLTAIKWLLELLLGEEAGKITKKQKDLLDQAMESNERMISLINDLLNISRIEAGKLSVNPELVDLVKLSEKMINEIKPQYLAKKQNFIFEHDKDIPTINLDQKLIYEAILNLLSNAIKYTPEKGDITFSLNLGEKDLKINVKDTGFGIPKAEQKNIFQKFYRSEKAEATETEGTGLGLFTVKSIVEISGGEISFVSEEGKGSTFTITLPLSGSKAVKGERTLA